jgi:hypothetical protein
MRRFYFSRAPSSPGGHRGSVRCCIVLLAALPALGGCSSHRADPALSAARRQSQLIYSPNGEPLSGGALGAPSCIDAMSGWFERVDANHDGVIDRDEFLADSRRQFAVMDLDKDGVVTPGELGQYRQPFLSTATRLVAAAGTPPAGEGARRERGGQGQPRRGTNDSDDAVPQDRPDPVMLADVNLRNRVTLADFMAYESRNFADLDRRRNGRLDKAEITRSCGPQDGS